MSEERDIRAAEYVLGTLDGSERDAFEAELTTNPRLAEAVRDWEVRLAGLADGIPTEDVSDKLWPKIEARLDTVVQQSDDFITIRKDEGQWIELYQGVEKKSLHIDREAGAETYLIRMAPGTRLIDHPHSMIEECLIVEGDVVLGGKKMGPGDYQAVMPGSRHTDIYTEGGTIFMVRGELRDIPPGLLRG